MRSLASLGELPPEFPFISMVQRFESYGLFNQATRGNCPARRSGKEAEPGTIQYIKYRYWSALKGVSANDAKIGYASLALEVIIPFRAIPQTKISQYMLTQIKPDNRDKIWAVFDSLSNRYRELKKIEFLRDEDQPKLPEKVDVVETSADTSSSPGEIATRTTQPVSSRAVKSDPVSKLSWLSFIFKIYKSRALKMVLMVLLAYKAGSYYSLNQIPTSRLRSTINLPSS